jgi:hypothetical protein
LTGLIWLRLAEVAGFWVFGNGTFGFHKVQELFRLAEGLAAFQEGPCPFESVTKQLFHIATYYFRPDCHFNAGNCFIHNSLSLCGFGSTPHSRQKTRRYEIYFIRFATVR